MNPPFVSTTFRQSRQDVSEGGSVERLINGLRKNVAFSLTLQTTNHMLITSSCSQKQTNFACEYSVDYLLLCTTEKSHINNSGFVFHFVFRVSAIFG